MSDLNTFTGGLSWQPQDLVGQVLSERYLVKKMLGEGGMGSVFLGEHVTLRKRVAIKVLHQDLCRDQTQVDRFLQEARAASMIGHEHIVDIVDFGSVPGGSVYFAMEYLEGEDLSDLLHRERRLPWSRARDLMLQIVRALAAAHNKGIVHRDLKPANCFLVRRSDGSDFVKLLDFGIAKVTDPEGEKKGLTRTGAIFGTAKYMAPEQAMGEPADARTDIYAAAVCLYEFMTGQVPYDGDNFMRVLSRHLTEPLTPPSTVVPGAITPAVEAIIVKALSKKPIDRYQSMEEFEQALLAVGPDGQLIGGIGGSTLWLDPNAQRPPSVPDGTVMLDDQEQLQALNNGGSWPSAPPPPGGTALVTGPGSGAIPITNAPANYSRPPTPSTNPSNPNVTMYVGAEPQSSLKFGLVLGLGALLAIVGGGLVAFLLMRPGSEDTVVAHNSNTEVTSDPTEEPSNQESNPSAVAIPEAPEPTATPDEATPTEPDAPSLETDEQPVNDASLGEAEGEDESATEVSPATDEPSDLVIEEDDDETKAAAETSSRRTRRERTSSEQSRRKERPEKRIPDQLSGADVSRGFRAARSAVHRCSGALPGMQIQIATTIGSSGSVISATPRGPNANLPVAKCAAKAVKSSAKFPQTKASLTTKNWTYKF